LSLLTEEEQYMVKDTRKQKRIMY